MHFSQSTWFSMEAPTEREILKIHQSLKASACVCSVTVESVLQMLRDIHTQCSWLGELKGQDNGTPGEEGASHSWSHSARSSLRKLLPTFWQTQFWATISFSHKSSTI